jgi:hypothetical protein
MRRARLAIALAACACAAAGRAAEPDARRAEMSGTFTASYYALPHERDFAVGVGALERDALHLEARYNYEARDTGSLFAGWKFSGGDKLAWQVTPILGALVGKAAGVVPGVEASAAYESVDVYVEAEYVADLRHHSDSYFYAWSELGWRPVKWLRLGLVGQRTHTVTNERDLQRGPFAQLTLGPATLGFYVFNPDSASRYAIVSAAFAF